MMARRPDSGKSISSAIEGVIHGAPHGSATA
jgi:hypothetical protein